MLRDLIVEKEVLRRQNMALCKEIQGHKPFHKTLLSQIQVALENDGLFLLVSGERQWLLAPFRQWSAVVLILSVLT